MRCSTFVFAFNCSSFSSAMKVAIQSRYQKPTAKSGSLYFWNETVMRPGYSDAEKADVYCRRVVVARAMTRKLSMDWTPHKCPPCVLKSKWALKWDSQNNVWTPHQRVDMDLANQIWELDVWKWKTNRISDGNSLSPSWRCELKRLLELHLWRCERASR